MGSAKAPIFNLPPLPEQGSLPTASSLDNVITNVEKGKSKEKIGKDDQKMLTKGQPTQSPNLARLKAFLAATWLLFILCLIGMVYVAMRYKSDRDALKERMATKLNEIPEST